VSEQVARAMAEGALRHSRAEIAVSVTGVAGPGGGSAAKPVGLVHFACARASAETIHAKELFGDRGRDAIRRQSVLEALGLVRVQAERAVLPL
jgi:nicotinamide-nucleotide amidase